jgi:hypothetical protein
MVPLGIQFWKPSSGPDRNLGVSCSEEGLLLGGTALIERRDWAPRAKFDQPTEEHVIPSEMAVLAARLAGRG